ncbi:MAG: hypothetical protein DMF50_02615, partial [Acidobacteria bacterium]
MTPACSLLLALAAASPAAQARPPADPAPSPGPAPAPSPAPGTEQAPSASPSPAPAPPSPPAASAPEGPAREEGGGAEAAAPAQEGPAAPPEAEKQVIGQVVVDGNVRVSDSAFFNSLKLKSGDPYDERAIQDEYRRLWDLDLFDDIVVESRRRDARTVDLIFHVRDRPLINNVAFVGMKAVTETNIQERLVQAKCEVRRGEPVDFSVLRRAEAAIEQLLAEKGYLQARCRARLTAINPSQREVTFDVHEGAKTKIKKIDFIGNTVYSDRKLRKSLKLTKQAFWLTSWASSKTLYHPAKFDQDAENIRTAYKSLGYLDVLIKPEVVELETNVKRRERLERAKRQGKGSPAGAAAAEAAQDEEDEEPFAEETPAPAPPAGETERQRKKRVNAELKAKKQREKKPKKWVYLTVPIDEGTQYRAGKIDIEGNKVFSDAEIMARLPLRTGQVFNDSALKYGTKRIEDDYGERGYFYVSLDPQLDKHDRVADVKIEITEDKKYLVDRIEFTGNSNTRDGVLRREMRLNEGDLFNVRLLRLGMRKIAQLGYWQVGEDPIVKPETDSSQVNIEVQGTESNRNEIQVGGGVSGLEGGFFQASYSTRNFLGRGEILSTFIQSGARANRYSINFTEPYFLGKPWTLGFSLYKRETDYVGFKQLGSGGNVFLGRLLGNFSRVDIGYGYETVQFVTTQAGFAVNRQTSATSSLTSVYSHDTRNNFFRPTRGARLATSLEYAGGVLGGDNYFVKPRLDTTFYLPGLSRRHYIGLNASYGYVQAFGGKVIPTFERYFLGGERSLRVFRSRQVSPRRTDQDLSSTCRRTSITTASSTPARTRTATASWTPARTSTATASSTPARTRTATAGSIARMPTTMAASTGPRISRTASGRPTVRRTTWIWTATRTGRRTRTATASWTRERTTPPTAGTATAGSIMPSRTTATAASIRARTPTA